MQNNSSLSVQYGDNTIYNLLGKNTIIIETIIKQKHFSRPNNYTS